MKKKILYICGILVSLSVIVTAIVILISDFSQIADINKENSLNFAYEDYNKYGEVHTEHIILDSPCTLYYPDTEDKDFEEIHVTQSDSIIITFEEDSGADSFYFGDWIAVYDENASINSSEEDVYFEATYLSDQSTALETQAEAYYNEAEATKGYKVEVSEKVTWKELIDYYDLGSSVMGNAASYSSFFVSYDWDIDVWRYVIKDNANKKIIETLFFQRADGFYRVEMHYPKKDETAKEGVYHMLECIDFCVDIENLQKIQDSLVYEEVFTQEGVTYIEVTNTGDSVAEIIYCGLAKTDETSAKRIGVAHYVQPGDTASFRVSPEIYGEPPYNIEVTAYPAFLQRNSDGEWIESY